MHITAAFAVAAAVTCMDSGLPVPHLILLCPRAVRQGYYDAALAQGEKALALDPTNERLQGNMKFYRQKVQPPEEGKEEL